jgi:hypothetical protein
MNRRFWLVAIFIACALLAGNLGARDPDAYIEIMRSPHQPGYVQLVRPLTVSTFHYGAKPGDYPIDSAWYDAIVIQRPILDGDRTSDWYMWRQEAIDTGKASIAGEVVLTVRGATAPGKDPIDLRSFRLVNAWPSKYEIVEDDDPGGGKAGSVTFQERLTLEYERLEFYP